MYRLICTCLAVYTENSSITCPLLKTSGVTLKGFPSIAPWVNLIAAHFAELTKTCHHILGCTHALVPCLRFVDVWGENNEIFCKAACFTVIRINRFASCAVHSVIIEPRSVIFLMSFWLLGYKSNRRRLSLTGPHGLPSWSSPADAGLLAKGARRKAQVWADSWNSRQNDSKPEQSENTPGNV